MTIELGFCTLDLGEKEKCGIYIYTYYLQEEPAPPPHNLFLFLQRPRLEENKSYNKHCFALILLTLGKPSPFHTACLANV